MLPVIDGYAVIVLQMLAGVILGAIGVLGPGADRLLNRLVFTALTPCLLYTVTYRADVPVHPVVRRPRRRALGGRRHGHVRRGGQALVGATPGQRDHPGSRRRLHERQLHRDTGGHLRAGRCRGRASGAPAPTPRHHAAGAAHARPPGASRRQPACPSRASAQPAGRRDHRRRRHLGARLEPARRRPRRSRGARPRRGARDPHRVRHRADGPAGALARHRPQGGPPRHRDQGGADARRSLSSWRAICSASRSTRC